MTEIDVVVDDLAFVDADAILRPADDALAPVTPATVRVDLQAGATFAALCRVNAPLDAGAAVVTGGGELSAPLVIHCVLQDAERPGGREVVRRALLSAWQRAADWQLERLAAPPVGMGPGRLSLEEAAALLAETFPRAGTAPRALRIVVEREDDRATVDAVIRRLRA